MIYRAYLQRLLFLLIGIYTFSYPQVDTDFLTDLGVDSESGIPDEDIQLINQLIFLPNKAVDQFRQIVTTLSFCDEESRDYLMHTISFNTIDSYLNPASPVLLQYLAQYYLQNAAESPSRFSFKAIQSVKYAYSGNYSWQAADLAYGATFYRDPNSLSGYKIPSIFWVKSNTKQSLFLGDYQVLTGYGLTFWRSVASGKGFETVLSGNTSQFRIIPFRSTTNSWSLRGAAIQRSLDPITICIGYSYRTVNGYFDEDGYSVRQTRWQEGSSHENLMFVQSLVSYTSGRVGAVFVSSQYSNSSSSEHFKRMSLFGSHTFRGVTFFGELNPLLDGNLLGGISFKSKLVRMVIVGRSLNKPFPGSRQNPFSEWKSINRNEFGIFQGILVTFINNKVYGFIDIFRELNTPRQQLYSVSGRDLGLRWLYKKEKWRVRSQWKSENKLYPDINYGEQIMTSTATKSAVACAFYFQPSTHQILKINIMETHARETDDYSHGRGGEISWSGEIRQKQTLKISLIHSKVQSFASRLYFWDINLPGEMRSLMVSTSGISTALGYRIKFPLGGEIGFRIRYTWDPTFQQVEKSYFGLLLSTG